MPTKNFFFLKICYFVAHNEVPVGFIVNFKNPKRFKFSIMTIVYTFFRDDALKMSPSILSFFLREMYFF